MSALTEKAAKSLFSEDGDKAVNVKFFLGSKRVITAEELAGQLLRADAQIRTGLAVPSSAVDGELTSTAI